MTSITTAEKLMEPVRNASISTRHVTKAAYFYDVVDKVLAAENVEYGHLANLFCGNGLSTWYWLLQKEKLKSFSVDINHTSKYGQIEAAVLQAFPELRDKNHFVQSDLTTSEFYDRLGPTYLAVAVHACGNLSDMFIKNCTKRRQLFALVTCCHDTDSLVLIPKNYPDGSRYEKDKFDVYLDLIRAQYAREQGYDVYLENLPSEITPKNRVIVGIPN